LIGEYSIPININAAKVIRAYAAGVAGIALNGIDLSVSHVLNNAHMVALAVCFPIEKDDVTGTGRIAIILPLLSILKPLDARRTPGKPRNNASVVYINILPSEAYKVECSSL